MRLTPGSLYFTSGPLPQYPLYYYCAPDQSAVVVCSEMEPLLRMVPSGGLDVRRLVALSAWQLNEDPAATAFLAVRRVRACEYFTADAGGIRSFRRVPRVGASYRRDRPEDLAVELRERLEGAVGRAIGDARRVAVFVGGGLDSSGLAALALAKCRGAQPRELRAIAGVWAAPGDDRPHLDTLERELGIVAVRIQARDAAPWFTRSLCADAQPQVFFGTCGEMLLWSAGAAAGADVALGGYGGDFVCGGDVSFANQLLQGQPLAALLNAFRLEVPWDTSALGRLTWVLGPLVRPLLPDAWVDARRRRRAHRPWMTRRFREILDPLLHPSRQAPRTPGDRMEDFCDYALWGELAVSWGQIASTTGATPVDVFRDLELVRFFAEIDPVMVSHGHRHRGLYRLAMRGVLPDSIRFRRDKALGEPFVAGAALAADALGTLRDLGSLERLAALDLVDPPEFELLFARWLDSLRRGERVEPDPLDGATWNQIWPVLSVEAFLRAYGTREMGRSNDEVRWPGRAVDGKVQHLRRA